MYHGWKENDDTRGSSGEQRADARQCRPRRLFALRKAPCKRRSTAILLGKIHRRGNDAPTPARTVGLPPRGGQYFLSKRKKVPKKHAARRLREKVIYCPFCRRGSQRRAQFSWTANSIASARSCAHLFPPPKWACLFPFAAYRRAAPPQVAWDRLNQCELGCCIVAW